MVDLAQSLLASPRRGRLRSLPSSCPGVVLFAIDVVAMFGVAALADLAPVFFPEAAPAMRTGLGGYMCAILFLAALCLEGFYRAAALQHPGKIVGRLVALWLVVLLFVLTTAYSAELDLRSFDWSLLFVAIAAPLALLPQRAIFTWRARESDSSSLSTTTIPFIVSEAAVQPAEPGSAARLFVLPSLADVSPSVLRELSAAIQMSDCNEIHIVSPAATLQDCGQLLDELRGVSLPVRLIASPAQAELLRYPVSRIGSRFAFDLQQPRLTILDRLIKRGFDLFASAALLVFFAPLLALVAAAVWLTSPGSILFRQTRIGRDGYAFTIYKFRTMTVEENGPSVVQATRGDPRVTPLGRVLRRTSIDELPQLLNVLTGEMSLIGPRPHAAAHDQTFAESVADYRLRRLVKPGLTGLAQVSGFRGEITDPSAIERRVALDIAYIEQWSLGLDLRILFRTFAAVIRPTNAF